MNPLVGHVANENASNVLCSTDLVKSFDATTGGICPAHFWAHLDGVKHPHEVYNFATTHSAGEQPLAGCSPVEFCGASMAGHVHARITQATMRFQASSSRRSDGTERELPAVG